jgi:hypothetical protein
MPSVTPSKKSGGSLKKGSKSAYTGFMKLEIPKVIL